MAGTAYHMEALRKTRVIERKVQALKRFEETLGQTDGTGSGGDGKQPDFLAFAEIGQYQQARDINVYPPPQMHQRKFVRRPKDTTIRKPTPESVKRIPRDQVYAILHPKKHNHWRIGRERDRKQYDHSRDGPIVDRTRYALKQEFSFLGNSLSMLKADIRPEHKPIPTCRRY